MVRADVYQSVTDRIIAALEAGTVPWRRPWTGGGPINIRNGRSYRGVNVFLLGLAPYADPRWGTLKAINEAGGKVLKGEKSTWIILWKPVRKRRHEEQAEDEQTLDDTYMLLRMYPVFNVEQAEGVPPLPPEREHDPIERAEEIAAGYVKGPEVRFGGGEASYSPSGDLVRCPALGQFELAEAFYSTLYHELVHSTGHESRLARLESFGFGTGPYAKEELVAEMGAAMLCGTAGIDNLDQSAAYVDGWRDRLGQDPKLIVQAAAQAQKAADLILSEAFGSDSQESENREAVAA